MNILSSVLIEAVYASTKDAEDEFPRVGWVKSCVVLERATSLLDWGIEDVQSIFLGDSEYECEDLDVLYAQLALMARAGKYIEGVGNFGTDDIEPANPRFTECRLTEMGHKYILKEQNLRF